MFCGSFEKFHWTSEMEKNYVWNYLQCLEKREIKARLSALPGACHISGVNIRSSSSSSSQSKQSISAWTRSWRDVEKFTCRPFLHWNSIHALLLLRGEMGGWVFWVMTTFSFAWLLSSWVTICLLEWKQNILQHIWQQQQQQQDQRDPSEHDIC